VIWSYRDRGAVSQVHTNDEWRGNSCVTMRPRHSPSRQASAFYYCFPTTGLRDSSTLFFAWSLVTSLPYLYSLRLRLEMGLPFVTIASRVDSFSSWRLTQSYTDESTKQKNKSLRPEEIIQQHVPSALHLAPV